MRNTLAQDLAWERWYTCSHFRTIALKEIKTDGQIWVWVGDTNERAAWNECLRNAAEEQGKRGAVVSASSPVAAATKPSPADFSHPPAWRRGDEWAFRWESPRGTGTFVWTVEREDSIDGVEYYVVRSGSGRESLYLKTDLAWALDRVDGVVETRSVPPQIRYRWPLAVGVEWEQTITRERPVDRTTETYTRV